jgi:hypothetical protein
MTFALAELASGPVTAVLATWLAYHFARRQGSADAVRAERATAASDLYVRCGSFKRCFASTVVCQ